MRLAFVIVHYRAGAWLERSVSSILREISAEGLDAEILVVDNGSSAEERAALASLPVRTLPAGRNRGYAGALNLGFASTDADILFALNPDVLILPGCVAALLARLEAGAAAAGPRFFWDEGRSFLLPPTEERNRRSEILAALAGRGDRLAARARRRWRRRARRFWTAREPFETTGLSGALLALRRDALDRVGSFDEGYRLYFEEDDWLARLRRAGLASQFVPAAEAVHAYNQSAAAEPKAPGWFAESRERFFRTYYGPRFLRLLRWLERVPGRLTPLPEEGEGAPSVVLSGLERRSPVPLWVEVSPRREGFPAGAARLDPAPDGRWTVSDEIWASLAPGPYFVSLSDRSGRELRRFAFRR